MLVARDVASQRLAEYVKTAVLARLGTGKGANGARFRIGVALGMGLVRIADEHYEALKALGVVDASGAIDIDALRRGVMEGVSVAGGEVFVDRLGLWLSSDDVRGLLDYVESGVMKQ